MSDRVSGLYALTGMWCVLCRAMSDRCSGLCELMCLCPVMRNRCSGLCELTCLCGVMSDAYFCMILRVRAVVCVVVLCGGKSGETCEACFVHAMRCACASELKLCEIGGA